MPRRLTLLLILLSVILVLQASGCKSGALDSTKRIRENAFGKHDAQRMEATETTTGVSLKSNFAEIAEDPLLEPTGMLFKVPKDQPRMNEQAVIDKAIERTRGYGKATRVTAVYALYTNSSSLRPKSLGYSRDYILRDLPVWIVRVEGLEINGHGPTPQSPGPANTQMNVIIADATGEEIESFSFR